MGITSGPRIIKDGLTFAVDAASQSSYSLDDGVSRNFSAYYGWWDGTSTTNFGFNGDGNSLILDTNPWGDTAWVWDVSNQDATSDADGGWNTSNFPVDQNKMYRFSVWIRRKVIGNGSTYLGTYGKNSAGSNIGVRWLTSTSTTTNPYFTARSWWGSANKWYLLVGHVWPEGTPQRNAHQDSGIWDPNSLSRVVNENRDMVWLDGTTQAIHRTYLYYSTNTSTNQQFYNPRVDVIDGTEPTLYDLLYGRDLPSDSVKGSPISPLTVQPETQPSLGAESKVYFKFTPDNDNSKIEFDNNIAINKPEGTISVWVYPKGYSSSNGILINRSDPTANAGNWLWLGMWSSGGILYFRLGDGSSCCTNDLTISSASSSVPLNTWTNITVTWKENDSSHMYINGSLVNSRTIGAIGSGHPTTRGSIGLGHDSGTTGSWNGNIGTVLTYNRKLTADEVTRNYNATRLRWQGT